MPFCTLQVLQSFHTLNIPVDSPLMKYKGLMYDKQGHLAVFFENNMLIDRFGFIREVVL